MKHLKKSILLLAVAAMPFAFSSCGESFENTDKMVGKWQLVDYNGMAIDENFTWEFKADHSFAIHSEISEAIHPDAYDSEPWDGPGDFEGKWRLSGPTLIEYRQKYKQYGTVRISDVSDTELVFDLFGEYGTKFYEKEFTFKKVQ